MVRRSALVVMLLALVAPALAADENHEHGAAAHKTIALGRDRIVPEDLTMSSAEVLVFENYAATPQTVRFLSPDDQMDKVRCGLLGKGKAGRDLALFSWDYKKRLVATVGPGRFASVCSFAPGQYSYVVGAAASVGTGAGQKLEKKGTITVQ